MEILEKRAEEAFRPNAIGESVLQRIASEVAESSGDCREAFDLLLQAGRKADKNGDAEVTTETVDRVLSSWEISSY